MGNCCNLTLSNTGVGCVPVMDVTEKIIWTPRYNEDGSLFQLDLTDTFNLAYFNALVNQADPLQRIYPSPLLKGVTHEEDEDEFETHDDGSKQKLRDGIRHFYMMITSQNNNPGAVSPRMKKKLQNYGCGEKSAFLVTKSGQLVGYTSEAGFIAPLPYDPGTFTIKMPKATNAATQKITIGWDWSTLLDDSDLVTIEPDEMDNANILGLKGLLDVTSVITNEATTGFKAKLVTEYGTPINPVLVKGLVAGDFALYNVTDSASVTITTATENPDGTYTFVYTAQTSGDVLRLTPTKTGYDFSAVVTNTITTP